jgi:hypothetical protein
MRRSASPADLAPGTQILLGKNGAFPLLNVGGSYRNLLKEHSLNTAPSRSQVAFVVGHVNGWRNSPLGGIEALAAFVERYGASCYVVRKTAYLMSRYGDGPTLQAPFQRIAKKLSQSKFSAAYFSALDLMDCDLPYTTLIRLRRCLRRSRTKKWSSPTPSSPQRP